MKNTRDPIRAVAKVGILDKEHLAFFWAWEYYQQTGELPVGKAIPPGVLADYGEHIKPPTAYNGLRRLKEYLVQTRLVDMLQDESCTGSSGPVRIETEEETPGKVFLPGVFRFLVEAREYQSKEERDVY